MYSQLGLLLSYIPFPAALGLNPLVPSDPRETFMTILQKVPKLAASFTINMSRQGTSYYISPPYWFTINFTHSSHALLKYVIITLTLTVFCVRCKETFNNFYEEYHLQLDINSYQIEEALMEMDMPSYLKDYMCPE